MLWYLSDKHLKNGEKCRVYGIFTAKNDIKWGRVFAYIHSRAILTLSKQYTMSVVVFSANLPQKMTNMLSLW